LARVRLCESTLFEEKAGSATGRLSQNPASKVVLQSGDLGVVSGCVRPWWIFPAFSAPNASSLLVFIGITVRQIDGVMDAFGVVNIVQQRRVEGREHSIPEKIVGGIFLSRGRDRQAQNGRRAWRVSPRF